MLGSGQAMVLIKMAFQSIHPLRSAAEEGEESDLLSCRQMGGSRPAALAQVSGGERGGRTLLPCFIGVSVPTLVPQQ